MIPGGQSPDHIRTNKDVQRFVKEFDQAKKPMFVICHGPQVLISAQLVRGRTLTGFASIADDIRNAGGLYRDQPVVQDGNWVTSRNPRRPIAVQPRDPREARSAERPGLATRGARSRARERRSA